MSETTATVSARAAFGHVVNVKHLRSQGITRIEIEVPDNAHVAMTALLFGQTALVVPFKSDLPYGLVDSNTSVNPISKKDTPSAGTTRAAAPVHRGHGSVNPITWLGIHCRNEDFQEFLGVSGEEEVVAAVHRRCKVASRGDIKPPNLGAVRLFWELFNQYVAHRANVLGVPVEAATAAMGA